MCPFLRIMLAFGGLSGPASSPLMIALWREISGFVLKRFVWQVFVF